MRGIIDSIYYKVLNSGEIRIDSFIVSLFVILSFLVLNPFLCLFILAIAFIYIPIPKTVFIISATFAFTLFFFCREYGMTWADASSSDDIPTYILLYHTNQDIGFWEIFTRFFSSPASYEPLWHVPFWILLNVFNGSDQTFIFLNYFLIFILLFNAFKTVSGKYFILITLAYFFLTPGSVDSVFHIWRQQLGFSVFVLGCSLYLIENKRIGLFLVYITPLIHLVCLYFLIIFIVYNFLRKRNMIDRKLMFFVYSLALSFFFVAVFMAAINYLASLNIDRLLTYLEGSGGSNFRQLVVMSLFLGIVSLTHIFFRNDDFNKLVIIITFVVSIMTISFPYADSIFNRFSYFSVPLIALYFVRWLLLNFSKQWLILSTFFIFLTGLYRVYPLISQKLASMQFLGFGHPLDPSMGIVKLLLLLSDPQYANF